MSQEDTPAQGKTPDAVTTPDDKNDNVDTTPPVSGEPRKQFDEEYVRGIRSEAAERRKENQKLRERLEELEERDKSALEKATGKATKAEQKAAEAESKLTRYQVAADKKVPAEAVDFLKGNTREELEASADQLLSLVKSRNDTDRPDFDGGPREPTPDPKTPEQEHNELISALLLGGNQT